jgi:hypothetical protein
MASSESMKCLFKQQTFKQLKLAQLKKVLYKWFTVIGSNKNPVTGPMLIEKTN